MADNRQQQQQPQVALMDPKTIGAELQKMRGQIEAALPHHISPDRMARIALTACRISPKLFRCTKESFFGAVIIASQLGLEPNVNGQCYFVPYKNKHGLYICTFIPGWRGYMDLVSRSGRASAWTQAVFDGDEFDYEYGSKPFVRHKPGKWHGNIKALTYTYSVGAVKGMEDWPIIEVWTENQIWEHRNKNNKVGEEHYSFAHPEMYARKIPLLQVIKYLPSSVELNTASQLDIAGTEGRQRLTIDAAFAADYLGPEDSEIEFLMEKLNWDSEKRKEIRKSYEDRPDELLKYLQKEAAPLDNGKSQAKGSKPKEDTKPSDPPKPEQQTEQKNEAPPQQGAEPQSSMFGSRPQPGSFKF
jgi:recombination protein RecT